MKRGDMNQPSIKKNYIYRLAYEILNLIVPFITAPYISRILGAEGIGIYSYTGSVMSYFTLAAALGTSSYGTREIARCRSNKKEASKIFWEIEWIMVFTTSVCLAAWTGVIMFSRQYRCYYIALFPALLAKMFDISWFFAGLEKMKSIVIPNILCKSGGIVLLFWFVKEKEDLILYILIHTGTILLGNLSMWLYLPGMVQKAEIKTLEFKGHFHEIIIYFIPTVATSIYTVLDKTLIGMITNDHYQNGCYEQAVKIISIVKTIVFAAINSVMGARISYLFAKQKYAEIHQRVELSMNIILFLGYGCVFGMVGIAKTFVPFFLGEGYEQVISLLYSMSPLILIIGISNCLGSQYFTPSGQRRRSAKVILFRAVLNLCVNLLLIPRFGANGAAAASVLAETMISIIYVRMCDGYITVSFLAKASWKRVTAAFLMCGVISFLGKSITGWGLWILMVQIIVGIMLYSTVLLFMKDDAILYFLKSVWDMNRQKKGKGYGKA